MSLMWLLVLITIVLITVQVVEEIPIRILTWINIPQSLVLLIVVVIFSWCFGD